MGVFEQMAGLDHEQVVFCRDDDVGANFTLLHSRVRLRPRCEPSEGVDCSALSDTDVSTSRVRPLQDQSPFVVNAYLDYDNEDSGTGARVLYNIEGRKITNVGGLGLQDVYLSPRNKVDITFTQRLYRGLELNVSAENVANAAWEWKQANRVLSRWRDGVTFTIGLSYGFDRSKQDDE